MDVFEAASRAFAMSDAAWRRHANPWSGWTRLFLGLPLIALAIWSRVWLGWGALVLLAALAVWLWLNPRLFPEPAHFDAWVSRAVLGEKVFLEHRDALPRHHVRMAHVLAWASLPGLVILAVGLWAYWPGWVLTGIVLTVLPKLWFLDRMVWILQDWQEAGGAVWAETAR